MIQNATINLLNKYKHQFHPVVPFTTNPIRIFPLNLSATNKTLTPEIYNDIHFFRSYIDTHLEMHHCQYAIGGYNEWRDIYSSSSLFDGLASPRRLHLGVDVWGHVGTPIYAFMGGMVHSFAFNNRLGDYGATLILSHQLDSISFYTLYGHIALNDISILQPGNYVSRGNIIAHIGAPEENGNWPPHLHFQIITNIELYEGDYPGVCSKEEAEKYLFNCPDPELILNLKSHVINI